MIDSKTLGAPASARLAWFTAPNLLSEFRLLLAPFLLCLAWNQQSRLFFAVLILSLTTDMADGYLARRLKQCSTLGSRLDSWGDFITYLALPICGWWLRPDVIREEKFFLVAGIGSYLAAALIGFLKFRSLTSYHTHLGKVAAVLMGMVIVAFFAGAPGWPFRIAMPLAVLAEIEEIAITFVLKENRINVSSLYRAWKPSPSSGRAGP